MPFGAFGNAAAGGAEDGETGEMSLLMICVAGGALAGLLNGMLGVGGTFIIVPLLDAVIAHMGVSPAVAHVMAVGTAPPTVLFTCAASYFAHKRLGSVRRDILRTAAPFVFLGGIAGAFLAPYLPTGLLKIVFSFVVMAMGIVMLLPAARSSRQTASLPHLGLKAFFFGMLASMSGLAGTLICLTYLHGRGVPLKQAVGTSAGIGTVIAVTATLSYVLAGLHAPDLPAWSLGYVYLPGMAGIIVTSMCAAKAGAMLLHWKKMPLEPMRKGVGIACLLMAARVICQVVFP